MSDVTESDLFEAILAEYDVPFYDPALHLLPAVAAERWHIDQKAAVVIIRRRAEEWGLAEVRVRNPNTGKVVIAFGKK